MHPNVKALMVIRLVSDRGRFGCIEHNGEIALSMKEKAEIGSGFINSGIYIISQDIFQNFNQPAFSLEQDVLPELVSRRLLAIYETAGFFIDIGIPESYKQAQITVPTFIDSVSEVLN